MARRAYRAYVNRWEEEALSAFRDLEYQGDPLLALRFLKMLDEYFIERQDQEWGIPDE